MDFYESRYFRINKRMLTFMGLWPYQNKNVKIFLRSVYLMIMTLALVPQLMNLIKYSKVDGDKVVQGLAVSCYVSAMIIKLILSILVERKMRTVYEYIIEIWKTLEDKSEKKILAEHSEFGRKLTIGYMFYMFFALSGFIAMPMTPTLLDTYFPLDNNDTRPIIYILDGEYAVDKLANYEYIYLFEGFICIITVVTFTTLDPAYAVCVQQCVGLMAVVKGRLKLIRGQAKSKCKYIELTDQCSDFSYNSIIECIKLHQKSIEFADLLESSFSTNFLFIMGANVLVISIGSVIILINLGNPMQFLRYGMIFVGVNIHMFYLNYPGQQLTDSSGGIFHDSYDNEWYDCSAKSQKLLKFMMLRSKEPCRLTAGGIFFMNVVFSAQLAKTSISYITVLASYR